MDDVHNLDCIQRSLDAINNDERQRRQRQFPRSLHTALATLIGVQRERGDAIVNRLNDPLGGVGLSARM